MKFAVCLSLITAVLALPLPGGERRPTVGYDSQLSLLVTQSDQEVESPTLHLINRKWMVSTFEMEDILVHMHDVSPDGTVQDMNLKIEPWPPAAAYEELATATGMEVLMLNEMRYSLLQWSQVSPTTEDPRGKLARFTKANKQWMQQLKKVHSLRGSIQSDETGQNTRPSQDRQYRVETATKEAPAAIPSNSGLGDPNDLASAGVGIAENDTFARRPAILPLMQDSDRYSKMLEAAA